MSIIRKAEARWEGDLDSGRGTVSLGSKAYDGPYSFKGRISEQSSETNPEELIGAALAGCFSMQLSALLTKAGYLPNYIATSASVSLDKVNGLTVSKIDLETKASVPNISEEMFQEQAEKAKETCPISRALSGVKKVLKATLA